MAYMQVHFRNTALNSKRFCSYTMSPLLLHILLLEENWKSSELALIKVEPYSTIWETVLHLIHCWLPTTFYSVGALAFLLTLLCCALEVFGVVAEYNCLVITEKNGIIQFLPNITLHNSPLLLILERTRKHKENIKVLFPEIILFSLVRSQKWQQKKKQGTASRS